MGYAFTYPAARFLAGCRVACYVHFPMISSDMLDAVAERRPSYNNDARVADSVTASQLKLAYYRAFALAYRLVGKCAEVVMCNSTWTKNHISALWGTPALLVYPPCLEKASPSISMQRQPLIVSIGQFRPEKDHRLQLASIKSLRELGCARGKLVMIGSCRGAEDRARVEELKIYATEVLGLLPDTDFDFQLDISKVQVEDFLRVASIGIHTMWNEHFGIGIVEMMSAGMIVVAHNSGGPKSDIVIPNSGFLASTCVEYAQAMKQVLETPADFDVMRHRARDSASRFTEEEFGKRLVQGMQKLIM